jgi:hypothetical protein
VNTRDRDNSSERERVRERERDERESERERDERERERKKERKRRKETRFKKMMFHVILVPPEKNDDSSLPLPEGKVATVVLTWRSVQSDLGKRRLKGPTDKNAILYICTFVGTLFLFICSFQILSHYSRTV